MSEPDPLRLSKWTREPTGSSGSSEGDSLPPPPPPPPPGKTKKTSSPKEAKSSGTGTKPSTGGGFPLPKTVFFGFDLLRLPWGILRRWWLPLPLALAGMILGVIAGAKLFEASATTTARLISLNPEAFAASRTAYTPTRVQAATLLQALGSPQVADRVSKRLGWGLSGREIAGLVTIQDVRRTDFVEILVDGPLSAEQAAELARVWAEEAIAFTSNLQSAESRDLLVYLQEQRESKDRELADTLLRIADLRETSGLVDADREIESYLRSLSVFNEEYEGNRVELQALEFQLTALRQEIRKHSPLFQELKQEEARLVELGEIYTPRNPIFQDAEDRVQTLRDRVNRSLQAEDVDYSEFTGTYVGNALYLQILQLQSRRTSLELRQQKLDAMRDQARERLRDLPDVALAATRLLESAQSLRAARDAITIRLQEVAGFNELAPGYFRIFRVPTPRDVYLSSPLKKTAVLSVFTGFLFFGFGVVCTGILEFIDPKLRTSREAAEIFSTQSLGTIKRPKKGLPEAQSVESQDLWARLFGEPEGETIKVFWAPQQHEADAVLWERLALAAQDLGLRVLLLHPGIAGVSTARGFVELTSLTPLPSGQPDGPTHMIVGEKDLKLPLAREATMRQSFDEIWIYLQGPVREPRTTILRQSPSLYLLCGLNRSNKDFWQLQSSLLRKTETIKGVIGLG